VSIPRRRLDVLLNAPWYKTLSFPFIWIKVNIIASHVTSDIQTAIFEVIQDAEKLIERLKSLRRNKKSG
jgi:hypothetical protein